MVVFILNGVKNGDFFICLKEEKLEIFNVLMSL